MNLTGFHDTLTRYNYFHVTARCLPDIDKALVTIPVKTVTELNINFVEHFYLLEWLAAQRPFVKRLNFVTPLFGRWSKSLHLSKNVSGKSLLLQLLLAVTIRGVNLPSFLSFISVSFLNLKDKFLAVNSYISSSLLMFSFASLDFLITKPEYLSVSKQLQIYFLISIGLASWLSNTSFSFFYFIRDSWFFLFPSLAFISVFWSKIYGRF